MNSYQKIKRSKAFFNSFQYIHCKSINNNNNKSMDHNEWDHHKNNGKLPPPLHSTPLHSLTSLA